MLETIGSLAIALPAPIVRAATGDAQDSPASTATNIFSGMFTALGNNGYQTGTALILATLALVAMINLGSNKLVSAAVASGAFWAGWLGWNTVTNSDNQLFPGDVQATKLWDVAFTSDIGFLFVVAVACLLAVLLWRGSTAMVNRVVMLIGGMLGASLVYNIFESLQHTA
jgi:hypothetical protein